MKRAASALSLVGSGFALPARAAHPMAVAVTYACLSCHALDHKLVGPPGKGVAKKYRAEKDAAAKLSEKVRKGGSSVWDSIPMPPNPGPSGAELKELVHDILRLK